jgi:RNA polymerase primary sigma factor
MAETRQIKIQPQFTPRGEKSFDKYAVEISKIPMISPDEEAELSLRIKSGDEKAMEKLVNSNLRFVVSVAKQYQNKGLTLGDLINEGNIGLMKAALRFDGTRGIRFISYAVWWIRQSILLALGDSSRLIRIPLNAAAPILKMRDAIEELTKINGVEPSIEEISLATKESPEKIKEILEIQTTHESLDKFYTEETQESLYDITEDTNVPRTDEKLMDESRKKDMLRVIEKILSPRESTIIKLYFGLSGEGSQKCEDIAANMGIHSQSVVFSKNLAIRKLRRSKQCARLLNA